MMLPILVKAGRIQGGTASCDDILAQFEEFIDVLVTCNKQEFVSFSPHDADQWIDELYFKFMSRNSRFDKVCSVINNVLVISHGQATVERGFSVNKEVEVENLQVLLLPND